LDPEERMCGVYVEDLDDVNGETQGSNIAYFE
jgi:hypothetical protein